ncbi:MAG: hypothetical protein QOK42_956 [Frankiaceae bacterium]|nr:hypothetical protein [Frankiaceae bacterium]
MALSRISNPETRSQKSPSIGVLPPGPELRGHQAGVTGSSPGPRSWGLRWRSGTDSQPTLATRSRLRLPIATSRGGSRPDNRRPGNGQSRQRLERAVRCGGAHRQGGRLPGTDHRGLADSRAALG